MQAVLPLAEDADANDDGQVEISDPIAMLDNLFQAGNELPRPFLSRGYDATTDTLFCRSRRAGTGFI